MPTTVLDYDSAIQDYTLQVSISDGIKLQMVVVKVDVEPANEHTPSFASNPSLSVSENEPVGYSVITHTASDGDLSPHDVTSYAISAGELSYFEPLVIYRWVKHQMLNILLNRFFYQIIVIIKMHSMYS